MTRTFAVRRIAVAAWGVVVCAAGEGRAQAPAGDGPLEQSQFIEETKDLSLSELLNMKVSLPTRIEQQQDEAPSIVSVISRKDIEAYGARDLADIMRRIPGFEFGMDVFGLVGMGQRGIWGHEGKVLVMLNGMTVNDLGYGNVNFFGTYPAAMIERVEVIRGPGSAVQGTFAEVGVINIITRQGGSLDGVAITGTGGVMGTDRTLSGNVAAGTKFNDLEVSVQAGHTSTPLSPRPYTDVLGVTTEQGLKLAPREWTHILGDITYKNALKVHVVHTFNDYGSMDGFGFTVPSTGFTERVNRNHYGIIASYDAVVNDKLSFEPTFEYIKANLINTPSGPHWTHNGDFATPFIDLQRYRGEVSGTYRVTEKITAMIGAGYQRDLAWQVGAAGQPGLQVEDGSFRFSTYTESRFAYAQYIQTLAPFGITLGARYENTSYGDALAPRAGLVFNYGPVTTKLLYGRAYRIPLPFQSYSRIANLAPEGIKPETSDTTEIQFGYSINQNIKARVNGFYTRVNEPLTYIGVANAYLNYGKVDSIGSELELDVRYEAYGGYLNGSYARPTSDTSPEFATVDGSHFLGLPPVKVAAGVYYRVGPVEIAPSLTFLSSRYGQSLASANSMGLLGNTRYAGLALADLAINWRDVLKLKGTWLQLSVHNLFNAPYRLIQPYYGSHAPMPAQDREVRLQITTAL